MRPHRRLFPYVSWLLIAGAILAARGRPQDAGWQRDLVAWRAQHAAELQKPDGWLSLAGLEWLEAGDNSFGSGAGNKIHLPAGGPEHLGVLHLEGATVTLNPPQGGFPQGFLVDGKPAQSQELHTDPDSDRHKPRMTIGMLNVYVVHRGERFALRIKDAKSPTLIGTSYAQQVPGAAEFTLAGKIYELEPVLEDPVVPRLFFILRDTTSASTTYDACRFLYTGLPTNGLDKPGKLVLDFNRLENPPCAYTPYATCPLPPPGNRLSIPLPAGEQRYHD